MYDRHPIAPTVVPFGESDVRRIVGTTSSGGNGGSLKIFVGTTAPTSPEVNDLWVNGGSSSTTPLPRIHVGTSALASPEVNDLWVDTN